MKPGGVDGMTAAARVEWRDYGKVNYGLAPSRAQIRLANLEEVEAAIRDAREASKKLALDG